MATPTPIVRRVDWRTLVVHHDKDHKAPDVAYEFSTRTFKKPQPIPGQPL
jgi:hypothetical protein